MAVFNNMVITAKGEDLYNKVQAGIPLNFTKMKIGSGQLAESDNPETFTVLKDYKFDVSISSITQNTQLQVAIISGTINNTTITEGQYICELGLFAEDPDEGEILYGYTNAGTLGDYIAPNNKGAFAWNYQVNAAVGNAAEVTATVSSTTFDYAVASSSTTFAIISGTNQKEINQSIDTTFGLIKDTVNFEAGSFTATEDNTASFTITDVPYNPETDHVELFYLGNQRLALIDNYTMTGARIDLVDWALKSGEKITYNIWKFVNHVPIMADGANLQDNSVALRSLTEDVQENINQVPALTSQMAEKASEITFSVKKFGAKGDGVTDDTIALQAAFDYATQNNVNIFIDEGVYIVTSSLVININMGSQWELGHSKFSILGASNKTIFSSKISSGDVLKIKANINGTFATGVLIGNFKIVNFDISTIYLSNALVIEDTQHIEYKNIEIYKFKNGLILTNSDLNTWTEFNKFNNIIINSCVNNLVFDGKNSSFRNNRFENVYLVAVDSQGTPEEQTAIKMLNGIIYNNYWDIAISISGKATMFFIGSMSQMNFGNITYEINKSLVDNLYHLPRIKAYPKTGEGTLDSDSYIFNFTGVICGMNDQSAPKFEYVDGCEFTPTGNNRLNSSAVRPGVKLTSQQIVGWGTNNYELEYLDRRTRDGWDGGTTKFNILRYISDSNDDEGYVISSFQRSSANPKPNKVSIGLVPVDGDMTGYVRGFNLYMDGSIIEAGNGQKLVFDTNGIKRGTYKIYDVGTITKFWGSPGIEISPNGKVEYWGEITASTIADGQEFIVNSFNGNFDNIRNIQLTLVGNTLGSQAVVKSFTSTSMVVKANIKASCTIHYRIIGDKTIG